eukprot:SAG31_NODE_869_length_11344_cov_15.137839_1_plen_42_part_10
MVMAQWVFAAAVGWAAVANSSGNTRLTMEDQAAWAFSGGAWK